MEQKGKPSAEHLQDSLVISAIEKSIQDRAKQALTLGQYLLQRGGRLAAAESYFDHALSETEEKPVHIAALLGKAEVYRQRKSLEGAYQLLDRAEAIAKEVPDRRLVALAGLQRAEVMCSENRPAAALDQLEEAAEALSEIEGVCAESVQVALKQGAVCQQQMRLRDALVHYARAEQLARALNTAQSQPSGPVAVLAQAQVLFGLGRFPEAQEKSTEVSALLSKHSVQYMQLLRASAELKAAACEATGQLARAEEFLREAILTVPPEEMRLCPPLWAQLAVKNYNMGMTEEAREAQLLAEAGIHEHPSTDAYVHLAQLELLRGDVHAAQAYLAQAQIEAGDASQGVPDVGRQVGFELLQASLDLQKGSIALASERVASAHEDLAPTEEREEQCDQGVLIAILEFRGMLERLMQNHDQAESFHRQTLQMAQASGRRTSEAGAMANLARVASARLDHRSAYDLLTQAIDINRECGAELQVQALLFERATIPASGHEGSAQAARNTLRTVLDKSISLECLSLELPVRMSIATLDWQEGRSKEAVAGFQHVIAKAQAVGMHMMKLVAQGLLGTLLSDLGWSKQAEQHLDEALTGMEQWGLDIEVQQHFLERFRDLKGFPF